MARVLALSSQVARGHVGLSAVVPALQGLGHEVWPLPTVILSNHLGHKHAAGMQIAPSALEEMVDALDRNGWLDQIDSVFTGYLPSADHVQLASAIVRRLKSERTLLYLCDPIMGDEPGGLYLDPRAASATRDELVRLADVLTPNRYELGWLASRPVDTTEQIREAARALTTGTVVVTSALRREAFIDNLLLTSGEAARCEVLWRPDVPHGTGDLFAGLYLGHRLNGATDREALGRAAAGVEQAVLASQGCDELALVKSQGAWSAAKALDVRELD